MVNFSRRKFLQVGAMGSLGSALLANNSTASNMAIRIRKDVNSLDGMSPEIVALKKAVDLMKKGELPNNVAMAIDDGRRWIKQANIHGTKAQFTNCQHGNWFFLPWHRIYLYHFEEIIRELSGNDNFALPYWDWTSNRTLPKLFWGDDNPLNCPARGGDADSGRQPGRVPPMDENTRIGDSDYDRVFKSSKIAEMIQLNNFEDFGGGEVTMVGEENFAGILERGPHNRGHTWVGARAMPNGQFPNVTGDMFHGDSPTDPIFWLHHCNVDRLWSRWSQRHPNGHPSSKVWRMQTFNHFYGRDGKLIPETDRIPVSKTLNTTDLNYQYDSVDIVASNSTGTTTRVMTSLLVTDTLKANSLQSFKLNSNDIFLNGVKKIVDDPINPAEEQSVRLTISGVKPPKRLDTYYDVYLNCKQIKSETPITDASYVGSCTFFHGIGAGHSHNNGLSFAFNLNQKLIANYSNKPLSKDEPLEVAIIARIPVEGDGPAEVSELIKVNPEKVKIELIKKI